MTALDRADFEALLLAPGPDGLRAAIESGALDALVPELRAELSFVQKNAYHQLTCLEHSLLTAWAMRPPSFELRLLGLLHDLGKRECRRLNSKTGQEQYIGHPEASARQAERLLARLGYEPAFRARMVRRIADHMVLHLGANDAVKPASLDKILARLGDDLEVLTALQLADLSAMNPRMAAAKIPEALAFGRRLRARAALQAAGRPGANPGASR